MNLYDLSQQNKKKKPKLIKESQLAEFAPPGDDGGGDGFDDETLKRLAAQWFNGDEDPRVERTLAAAGWEIGQDEGYDDEPGVFVVQAGDVNGNSYMSWPADELREGVAEGSDNVGNTIKSLYQKIYDQGDDALEYLNTSAPLFAQFWDQYEGDLDSIIAEVSPKNLIRIAKELQAVAGQEGIAEGSANGMRLLAKYEEGQSVVKVYKNAEWGEYVVQFYDNGQRNPEADYHTDDKQDAIDSAASYLKKSTQGVAEADKLQGTPVVSLSDFGDKDNTKDKYGRTVPKKLKKDDPRVKFHKEPKQQGVAEGESKPVHRIALTVTDPNHPMVSKRGETIQRTVRVPGADPAKAINAAIAHYRRKGYKVHDHHYIGLVDEGVTEATRNPDLMSTDDFERSQIAQRDAERRSFKRAELQHELGHESNNLQVTINGRPWKVFPGRGYADSQQEFKFLQSMRDWAAKKSAQTGKKWEVYLTGAEPTVEMEEGVVGNALRWAGNKAGQVAGAAADAVGNQVGQAAKWAGGQIKQGAQTLGNKAVAAMGYEGPGPFGQDPNSQVVGNGLGQYKTVPKATAPQGNKLPAQYSEDNNLSELSNELLGRYKKELGIRASAADRAGDYDRGHEYFKKITKATLRQGENDARKHAQREKENEMMETRLNMMRKAGYDL